MLHEKGTSESTPAKLRMPHKIMSLYMVEILLSVILFCYFSSELI